MDALNTMSNLEFMLIQKMAKDSMKEIQGECASSSKLHDAGLARPSLVEQVTFMLKNVHAKLTQRPHKNDLRSNPTPGGKFAT